MGKIEPGDLADLIRGCRGGIALTGAGISTESGIPDFRSPGTGLYNTIDPMEYLSVDAFRKNPRRFWSNFSRLYGDLDDYQPNAGHIALAEMEAKGYLAAVATQNIDGLHFKAGSKRVYELHGHLRTVRCDHCEIHLPLQDAVLSARKGQTPLCADCGEPFRPDVVLFGDMMPEAFYQAAEAIRRAPFLLVVGSSLTVSPVNTLAFDARRLIIVNREPTPADSRAAMVLRGTIGEILPALAAAL